VWSMLTPRHLAQAASLGALDSGYTVRNGSIHTSAELERHRSTDRADDRPPPGAPADSCDSHIGLMVGMPSRDQR
jgi:hypothetical protein